MLKKYLISQWERLRSDYMKQRLVYFWYLSAVMSLAKIPLFTHGSRLFVILLYFPFVVITVIVFLCLSRSGLKSWILLVVPILSMLAGSAFHFFGVYLGNYASGGMVNFIAACSEVESTYFYVYGLMTLFPVILFDWMNIIHRFKPTTGFSSSEPG